MQLQISLEVNDANFTEFRDLILRHNNYQGPNDFALQRAFLVGVVLGILKEQAKAQKVKEGIEEARTSLAAEVDAWQITVTPPEVPEEEPVEEEPSEPEGLGV